MKRFFLSFFGLLMLIGTMPLGAACVPAGTAGDDAVVCTGATSGHQRFYGGSDHVTLQNTTGSGNYWLDESLGGNPATDGNDTFIANNSQFFWVLGFGGDDVFDINHSEFNNTYGDTNPGHGLSQRGNDTIFIKNSISFGYIQGGNDNDKIEIIDSNVSIVASGYSDIYPVDYSPYDGNDTILLDHVNFTAPLYWDATQIEGAVGGGRSDDTITFKNGGEAYYVYGGHGNDVVEVFDDEHFNDCNTSSQIVERCGIYGDESYVSEPNATAIPILHGDDRIVLHGGDASGILIQGGHGSDTLTIDTPVMLTGTTLDGGDDRLAADTFVDRIEFEQWLGDLNGSQFHNWEQIRLHDASAITLVDNNISAGIDGGVDASSGLPYGLIVDDRSQLNLYHDFTIDGNLHNDAIINLQDGNVAGSVVTVKGDYHASSGELYVDTVLNDATPSVSDKLVIEGDTAGVTTLNVNNIGGAGGQTPTADNSGILVVEVHGNSNGTFALNAPLETPEYWYSLVKGSNGNWYLQSISIVCWCKNLSSDCAGSQGLFWLMSLLILVAAFVPALRRSFKP